MLIRSQMLRILLLATLAVSVWGQCLSEDDNILVGGTDLVQSRSRLYKGESIFTLRALNAINEATPNENVLYSPYSLYHVLLLMYFGARGNTEKMLKKGLDLHWTDSKTAVWQAYDNGRKELVKRFKVGSAIDFTSVDKLFFGKNVPINECMKERFAEEVQLLDFANDPEEQRININNWVSEKTRGEIKDLLIPGSITRNTMLAVANAAYFKGTWQNKFKAEDTKKEIFYISADRQAFVDMMHVQGSFNHAANEKLGCHILELPYSQSGDDRSTISMFVFLPPAEPNSLDKLLARLSAETDVLSEVVGDGILRTVDVKLPKFNIEKDLSMKTILNRLGMGGIFDLQADFGRFASNASIVFDEVQQKSKIEVNEEGTVAASATVGFSFRSSRPLEPALFHCNHPFVFIIYDYATRSVLFNGIYRKPE